MSIETEAIEGRISHLECHDERPDRNIYRSLSYVLFGLLFFIPFSLTFLISGMISLSFAVIGFSSLSHLFNPVTWSIAVFEMMEILVLRRIGQSNLTPVYRGIVEDVGYQPFNFRMRGPLRMGNLIAGHLVRLSGRWERGTLLVQEGTDITTNAAIVSDHRNPWQVLFYILSVLNGAMILGLLIVLRKGVVINW